MGPLTVVSMSGKEKETGTVVETMVCTVTLYSCMDNSIGYTEKTQATSRSDRRQWPE